jgi:hypothetical protein
MLACGPLQQSTKFPVPTDTSAVAPVPSITSTVIPTLASTSTAAPTPVPSPIITATPMEGDINPFRFVTSLDSLPVDSTGQMQVRTLADGSVWLITSQAVMRWDGQAWEVMLDESEGVLAAVDDGGQLWVLRQDTSEISAWQDGRWTTYSDDSGWTSVGTFEVSGWAPAPWSVYTDAGGTLWVPMERDVRTFDGNGWRVYTLEDMSFPLPEMEEISIVHDLAMVENNAEVWVGECYYSGPGPMGGGGVRWFDGQTWQGVDAPVGSKCVSAMEVDQFGNVWLGVYDVIWRYEHTGKSWTEYRLPETLLSGYNFAYPLQLIVDQVGEVWVIEQMCGGASCGGPVNLYRIHDGEWSLIIGAEYWESSFKQLVLDGNGQGWLFWEGMFYKLEGDPLESIVSIAARGVDVSTNGSIWVAIGSGEEGSLQVLKP